MSPTLVGSLSNYDSSGETSEDDTLHQRLQERMNQSVNSLTVDSANTTNKTTIIVQKRTPEEKAGISLIERKKKVYITNISQYGLFHGTSAEVGDVIVSINGKRLKDEGVKQVMKTISKAETTVTIVLRKKAKPSRNARSMSPLSRRRQARKDSQKPTAAPNGNGSRKGVDAKASTTSTPNSPLEVQQSITTQSSQKDLGAAEQTSHGEDDSKSNGSGYKKMKSKKNKKKSKSLSISPGVKSPTKKKSFSKRTACKVGSKSHNGDNASLASLKDSLSPSLSSRRGVMSARNLASESNQSFDYEDFPGDYIKIKVAKQSEAQPGFSFDLHGGKLIITALPEHEKRIRAGMQVLAINGMTNFISVASAQDRIHRYKADVLMVVDFSLPMNLSGAVCPCCSKPLNVVGKHISAKTPINSPLAEKNITTTGPDSPLSRNGSPDGMLANGKCSKTSEQSLNFSKQQSPGSRRITYRKLEEKQPDGAAVAAEMVSVAQSETTAKRNNRTPAGTRRTPRVTRPPKYHLEEFDSDDSEEDKSADPSPSPVGPRKRVPSTKKKAERSS